MSPILPIRHCRWICSQRKRGETPLVALVDPAGVRSEDAPHIEVALEWA